jgi:hypothetical protein
MVGALVGRAGLAGDGGLAELVGKLGDVGRQHLLEMSAMLAAEPSQWSTRSAARRSRARSPS